MSIRTQGEKNINKKKLLALLNFKSEIEPIMEVATTLARIHNGKIFARNFIVLPYLTPLEVGLRYADGPSENLRIASQFQVQNVLANFLLVLSHDPKLSILNTTREKNIDFVIMGIQGCMDIYKNLRNALSKIPTDTLILRPLPNKKIGGYRRILVPLLNGSHTPLAVEIACDLAKIFGQKLAILHEYEPRIYKESWEQVLNRLEAMPDSIPLERITYGQNSIISSILKEVNEDTWLILPAYRPSLCARYRPRCKQRNLLKEIIQCSDAPIMIVKKHERRIGFFQKILKRKWN